MMDAFGDLDHQAFIAGEIGETDDDGRPFGLRDITDGIWTALDAYVETARKALATTADQ
ncbi:hypothetical protein [Streptomyces abyssalis]|uniref:hypothetical protein n=1 Tax=Streptomyces abyssalis TaxID=933944 RepID=UPI001495FF83|nr:hypothetical protein [Streptomyces abyssalis]